MNIVRIPLTTVKTYLLYFAEQIAILSIGKALPNPETLAWKEIVAKPEIL